ncbi:ATP-dependent DNA helicase DinG [Gorillibacterium massiliense]|uniref:ATP-dependent DNA helicase DinG n=1 Tax=Gorillibacterium massiliense TaxID=1280390 RepID=UPI0004AD6304|nr:ATP-dependent DNA helicase DinG [Gorillibacterium massiliense]
MKFAVLDFETTGGQPADEIIQVGLVLIEDDKITTRYSTLVKPTIPIPAFITSLTGIDEAMVSEAPPLEEAVMNMQRLLKDSILVAHNAGFDFAFLQRALESSGYFKFNGIVLDTMDMLRIAFPTLPSLALGNVCETLGVTHERPHQADSDAEATAELLLLCKKRILELPLLTVQRIAAIFQDDPGDFGWFIRELCNQKEQASALDPDAYTYFRQFALNVGDWGEEEEERDRSEVVAHLDKPFSEFYEDIKKALQLKFDVFEEREAQDQMIAEVHTAFDEDRHLMVEAGTGTGKSLGYLLPALHYGILQDKKVLVSTHTINLQEQLRLRDLPLLKDIFPVPFKVSILKGRSHYLCLRKFEQKVTYYDYENGREDLISAAQMVVWLSETTDGEDEELHFGSRGGEFWRTVASDADSCLNRNCPWFKKCFYHRARHQANTSDVVITNHSLLFTDVKAEHRILPGYKHLVIDEAHNFEEVASKHLGTTVGHSTLVNAIAWLWKDSRTGKLPQLRQRLSRVENVPADELAAWCERVDNIVPKLADLRGKWEELAIQLFDELARGAASGDGGEGGQTVLRIRSEDMPERWPLFSDAEDELYADLSDVLKRLDRLLSDLKEKDELFEIQSLVTDIAGAVKDLTAFRDGLRLFIKRSERDYVYWLEGSPTQKLRSLLLNSVPVDVSPMLQEYIFGAKESVVLTSATLSVNKKFDYTIDQLGLSASQRADRLHTVLLPSPFNYRDQALMVIPRDFPVLKGARGEEEFTARLIDSLTEVARATKGRMLVLFTSYRMLKTVHVELRERLQQDGIQVYGQGMDGGSRSKLVRLFQQSKSAVLLGTSSFWEGVDIPGEALSCLVIVRLPFQPPNHPVVEAKCDRIKQENQNPFMKLSVPQAVIRFKQGFGRLVRTARDKGVVIVYDTRILETNYGKYFLYSLPGPKIEHMNTQQLVPRIIEWIEGEQI